MEAERAADGEWVRVAGGHGARAVRARRLLPAAGGTGRTLPYVRARLPAVRAARSPGCCDGSDEALRAAATELALVDMGAGRGELLTGVLAALPRRAVRARGVRRRAGRAARRASTRGSSGAGDRPAGVSRAAVRERVAGQRSGRRRRDGPARASRRVLVRADGEERLGEPVTGADAEWLDRWWPLTGPGGCGRRSAGPATRRGPRRSPRLDAGLAVAVDYAHDAAARPPFGTLTGFRGRARGAPGPGRQLRHHRACGAGRVCPPGSANCSPSARRCTVWASRAAARRSPWPRPTRRRTSAPSPAPARPPNSPPTAASATSPGCSSPSPGLRSTASAPRRYPVPRHPGARRPDAATRHGSPDAPTRHGSPGPAGPTPGTTGTGHRAPGTGAWTPPRHAGRDTVAHDGDDGRHRRRGGEHRHGAEHRPAASLHPRCAAAAARPGRRAHPARRAGHRLHAPRRREALRGARLPPDHHAGQPPRLAVGVLQRAGRRAGRRADARHGGPGARGLAAHAARRAEPGPQPPDVPRVVSPGARRNHPDLPRLPGARGPPARHGGDLRRPDALHVQPGRRPQGGPAGRLDRPGAGRGRRGPLADGRVRRPRPRQRDLPGPHPRRGRADRAEAVHAYGCQRPHRPRLRRRLRPAARRAVPGVRGAAGHPEGRHPRRRATAWPASSACWSRRTTHWSSPTPASTGSPSCRRGRSTSGCRRC